MNPYARPMPALGFDPTPGDVDETRSLAKRHHQVAEELRQILTTLEGLDLGNWEGKAADAARARLLNDLTPALRKSVSTADRLASATSSWASRLQEFQSEADELERKAAHQKSQQESHPTADNADQLRLQTTAGAPAPSSLSKTHDSAAELHTRYLAEAHKTAGETDESDGGIMEQLEPYRKVLETVLAPLDIIAADHWIDALEKVAGKPGEILESLDKQIEAVADLQKSGKPATEALLELANAAEESGGKLAALPEWVKTAAGSLGEIRGLGVALSGLGILADTATVVDPPDKGAMGWVDRGAAGVNAGLITANLAMDEIPVAGEVVMIGTGVYLAGDFLYHNWKPFRNVCNDVGHVTASAVKDTGHAIAHGWHSLTSSVGSWF